MSYLRSISTRRLLALWAGVVAAGAATAALALAATGGGPTPPAKPLKVVVPAPAVQTGQQGTYVFVVKPDQTVELRTVAVARTRGNDVVIQSGLKPGETVVTDGQLQLNDGSRVSPREAKAGS